MKNRKRSNFVMIAVIAVIVVAGILTVGSLQGWFDTTGHQALLTEIRGIVHVERSGVAFPAGKDTPLRQGDRIMCDPGASALIRLDDHRWVMVGQQARVEVVTPEAADFCAKVTGGEVVAAGISGEKSSGSDAITLQFAEKEVKIGQAVLGLSVADDQQILRVYGGCVEDVRQGQMTRWVNDQIQPAEDMKQEDLTEFTMAALRKANAQQETCFTDAMLDALVLQRHDQPGDPTQPAATEPAATQPAAVESVPDTKPQDEQSDPEAEPPEQPEQSGGSAQQPTQPPATQPPVTQPPATQPPQTEPPQTQPPLMCSISIRCDTILDNMDQLDPSKVGYVPSDGWILYADVEFTQGETVFDVLQRACDDYGIPMEYSYSPSYGGNYIEGINNIYEFDCGPQSGWMYQVDGWFPNYGSSGYTLSGGESITFCYTCVGLGADVGGGV